MATSDETPDERVAELQAELAQAESEAATADAEYSLVRLSLDSPWYVSALDVTDASGGKLTIDRNGVLVDANAVDAILKQAQSAQVSVKVGK